MYVLPAGGLGILGTTYSHKDRWEDMRSSGLSNEDARSEQIQFEYLRTPTNTGWKMPLKQCVYVRVHVCVLHFGHTSFISNSAYIPAVN